uniref:Uncharacterized protein n=1 Tax=Anguilla anguilla TaxID=7936 RepID=A0A0E9T6Z7_ANGAN
MLCKMCCSPAPAEVREDLGQTGVTHLSI